MATQWYLKKKKKHTTKTNLNACFFFLSVIFILALMHHMFLHAYLNQASPPSAVNHGTMFVCFSCYVSLSPLSHSGTLNMCLSISSETMDSFVVLKQSLFYILCVMETYNKCILVLISFPFSVSFNSFSF